MRPHGLPRVQLRIPLCRPDGPSRQGGRAVLAAPQVARGHARGLEGLAARGEEGGLEGGEGGLALDHVPVVGIEAGQVYLVASLVVDVDVCVSMYHVSQVHHAVESREGGGDGDEAPHKHRRRDQRPYRLHLEPSDGNGGSDGRPSSAPKGGRVACAASASPRPHGRESPSRSLWGEKAATSQSREPRWTARAQAAAPSSASWWPLTTVKEAMATTEARCGAGEAARAKAAAVPLAG